MKNPAYAHYGPDYATMVLFLRRALVVLGSIGLMVASQYGEVTLANGIPFTWQTAALMFIVASTGPWLATLSMVGYLFYGSQFGFAKPPSITGGYLVGFLLVTPFMATAYDWASKLADENDAEWTEHAFWAALINALGLATIFACGWFWLAYGTPHLGAQQAFALGVAKFWLSEPLKWAILSGAYALLADARISMRQLI